MRTISVSIEGRSIPMAIDNLLEEEETVVNTYCLLENCLAQTFEIVEQILLEGEELQRRNRLPNMVKDYIERSATHAHSMLNSYLATHADNHTSAYFASVTSEVKGLHSGIVAPSEKCFSLSRTGSTNIVREGCLMILIFPLDAYKPNGVSVNNTLDFWVLTAEKFFNQLHYDHAEAIGYFVMKYVVTSGADLNTDEYYTRALTILAEVAREKGFLSNAVYFSQMVISGYGKLSKSRPTLHRLRLLMTVPPLPPTTKVSLQHRRVMVDDLKLFLRRLRKEGSILTLQVSIQYSFALSRTQLTDSSSMRTGAVE
jgi:hypothetical protein